MTVHFVGAGPGAADLLTVRAAALLARSPVCVYAGTYVEDAVLAHCAPGTRMVDTQHLDLDQIVAALVRAHEEGLEVVRLCSGDPSLYSALAEQTRRLDAAGVPWDVTPGVPAYAAAAATLGVELTVPELAQTVVLTRTRARSTVMPDSESLERTAAVGGSLVLHLAITRVRTLVGTLVGAYGADCPVAVVAFASQPREVVLRGTLVDIADQVERAGLRHTAVVIVGRALGAREDVACTARSHLYDPARARPAAPAEGAGS
ncbi:MAG: SAM-dependent methyltransferase [Nocardioidaceae bacterium]